ncbi:MAG TPA: ribonuclease H-like domain-containing protein [Sphingomonadales bacterium]
MTIHLHKGDLPDGLDFRGVEAVAVDTETMGLVPRRDRLCLVQLSAGDGVCHLVQIMPEQVGRDSAPNLRRLMEDPAIVKIFHYARFDVAVLKYNLGIAVNPIYCTKIASKLTRTYTDRHGLKDLCRELLDVDLSKQQQSSDWGAPELTEAQLAYAASDVLHLHRLRAELDRRLARMGRAHLAAAAFAFLPARAELDLLGWEEEDIFAH